MEFINTIARSLRSARTVELPHDNKDAAYMLLPMVISDQYRSVSDLLANSSFDINFAFGRVKRTLYHIAANCGSINCLILFLRRGININYQDIAGCTALHLAAKNGQKKCLGKLLEYKADVNIKNNEGLTTIHWLAVNGRTEILHDMLQYVTNVDVKDSQGQTSLHVACQNGHKTTVQCLLDNGADVNGTNYKNSTPLHFACSNGQRETAEILLKRGAKFEVNDNGETPLHTCIQGGYGETCEMLLRYNAGLFDDILLSVQNENIDYHKCYKVFSYLCLSDEDRCLRILVGLGEQASALGHKLLSVSSHFDSQVETFVKCIKFLCRLYKQSTPHEHISLDSYTISGSANPTQVKANTVFKPLDHLWSSLDEWMLLLKQEIDKKEQRQPVAAAVTCATSGDVNQDTVASDMSHLQVTDEAHNERSCSDNSTGLTMNTTACNDDDVDMLTVLTPRVCAIIQAYYLCCACQTAHTMTSPKFIEFVCTHDPVLKYFVTKNPKVIFHHFHFLLECAELMSRFLHIIRAQPFELKCSWFYENLQGESEHTDMLHVPTDGRSTLSVERENLFRSSCQRILNSEPEKLKKGISIKFEGEDGVGQGVVREWFDVMSLEILNPDYGLFTPSTDGCTFQPNRNSSINPDHLNYFCFVGQAMGLALYHKQLLNVYFTRSFYKHILGIPVNYTDVASIDLLYAQNLQWLLDNDIDEDSKLGLTFSVEVEEFGVISEVELKPGGSLIPVTNTNKNEYIQLVTEFRMTRGIQPQINSFLSGFNLYIPQSLVQMFDETELEIMLSGLPEIDLSDWKVNTDYCDYTEDHYVIQWFWEMLEDYSQQNLMQLLQFTTGSSRVPHGGFSSLIGVGGKQHFTIAYTQYKDDILPTASTCVNLLKLPEYQTKAQLCDRMSVALSHGGVGYGTA